MIEFYSENNFQLENETSISKWILEIIINEGFELGDITYVFCDDEYLLKLNQEFLNHDTLTDIISFDYSLGKQLNGEIYISTERVTENALELSIPFLDELHRVIIHGIFHYCGLKDKNVEEELMMRNKENDALLLRNFT